MGVVGRPQRFKHASPFVQQYVPDRNRLLLLMREPLGVCGGNARLNAPDPIAQPLPPHVVPSECEPRDQVAVEPLKGIDKPISRGKWLKIGHGTPIWGTGTASEGDVRLMRRTLPVLVALGSQVVRAQ